MAEIRDGLPYVWVTTVAELLCWYSFACCTDIIYVVDEW